MFKRIENSTIIASDEGFRVNIHTAGLDDSAIMYMEGDRVLIIDAVWDHEFEPNVFDIKVPDTLWWNKPKDVELTESERRTVLGRIQRVMQFSGDPYRMTGFPPKYR